MKVTKFNSELENLDLNELFQKRDQLKREHFSLRLNAMTAHVKDYSQFKKLRKDIARIMTQINDKILNKQN